MKRLELLIEEARELTGNTRYDADSGISQAIFVRFFKNAQDALQKGIANAKSKLLMVDTTATVVSGQEAYGYPSDLFLNNIDTLEYSSNGTDYGVPLKKGYTKDRRSSSNGSPSSYVLRKDDYLLVPPVSSGTLRINYIRKLPALEKRSGYISAVTQASGVVSAITVDVAEASFDGTWINKNYYLCVVDKHGARTVKNIPYTSVNTTTGVFTLPASFTLASGESIAVGNYITVGVDTYNLPDLADICESYLIKHAVYEAKYGDASQWSDKAVQDMNISLSSLLDSFSRSSDDITEIPITNFENI